MSLSIPALEPDTDTLAAALAYADAGLYLLPVRSRKHPGSVVGAGWPAKSSRDPDQLAAWFSGTDHGLALHAGRSGALVLDVDHPEALPELLAEAFRARPAPFQSTRDHAGARGHHVYAMPPGRRIGNGAGRLGRSWGEVRGANGVIVLAPSRHPAAEQGGRYRWERTGPVPALPAALAAALDDTDDEEGTATDAEIETFLAAHTVSTSGSAALLGVVLGQARAAAAAGSRHDAVRDAVCMAMRDARAGLYPARTAADELRVLLRELAEHDRRTAAEFDGILAWAIRRAEAEPEDKIAERRDRTALPEPYLLRPGPAPVTAPAGPLPTLPSEFWTARKSLEHVRRAAHARCVSADLVLVAVLARLASQCHHETRVETGLGAATLNLFAVVAGSSGAGKSTGSGVARELVPAPDSIALGDGYRDGVPIGSGEGLAELFMGTREEPTEEEFKSGPRKGETKTRPVRAQVRHNALVYVDEGETLFRTTERKGATIAPTLRSAWTGGVFGQANASAETTRIIPGGTYALGLVIGVQVDTVAPLFADAAGGTPQRFLFASATDPAIPDVGPDWPGPLDGITPIGTDPDRVIPVTDHEVRTRLRAEHLARHRGRAPHEDPLDAHRPLHLAKVAALLALLDGRHEVDAEDWSLAEQVWTTSTAVRSALLARGRDLDHERAEARAASYVEREERAAVARDQAGGRVVRIATRLVEHVRDGEHGRAPLRRRLPSRDRGLYDSAVEHATLHDWLRHTTGGLLELGEETP